MQKKEPNLEAVSSKMEAQNYETISFIDVAAAYLIQQGTENETFCLMDVDIHQTIFYVFSIENQKFRFQKETIVPHSKVLQKLFQLETASTTLLQELEQELPDIWNTSEIDMLMASISANHTDITYQDIKIGLQEWFAACPKAENHQIRQICSDHAIATLLRQCFKMAQQPLMDTILSKKQVLQTPVSDNIYPEIRETIGVELYDAMNQLFVIPLLQAGMTYTEFCFPHYSPFPCWAYWNQNPTLPTLKRGNQPISIPDLRLPEWGKSDKTWGDFELKSFKIGVSVTRHSQIKLHLETATAKNQYLIGTI